MIPYTYTGLLLICSLTAHPLKISTCLISHQKESKDLTIDLYFFEDDFSDHLSKLNGKKISTADNSSRTIQYIDHYIGRNLKLLHNGNEMNFDFKKTQLEDNVLQVQYKVDDFTLNNGLNTFSITNTLLFDAFDEQSNILRFDLKGDQNFTSFRFQKGEGTQVYKHEN